ncbi:MAG: acyl carrier protein [Allomuricauda sp.]
MENNNVENVKNKLKNIIVNDLEVPVDLNEIKDNVSLYDDGLGLDSITIVNFIVLIEKKFKIDFDSIEISGEVFGCLDNLAEFITSKVDPEMKDVPLN